MPNLRWKRGYPTAAYTRNTAPEKANGPDSWRGFSARPPRFWGAEAYRGTSCDDTSGKTRDHPRHHSCWFVQATHTTTWASATHSSHLVQECVQQCDGAIAQHSELHLQGGLRLLKVVH